MRSIVLCCGLFAACNPPPPVMLVEGFCPNMEAERCYFAQSPMDGF